MNENGKTATEPTRQAAMLAGVASYAERTGGRRAPMEYPAPYPYWLRGKVARIRR